MAIVRFKVNLHVHGEGNDPKEIVRVARAAQIDLIAITDHQSFVYCDPIIEAARSQSGRALTVLPGIEITAHEGAHILALFPPTFTRERRERFVGWLEITGSGNTSEAARQNVTNIFEKVTSEGGVIVVPHPFSEKIGLLDSARKMNTKVAWLESGHVNLMQVDAEKVKYVARDQDENWVNRIVLASARPPDIETSSYCLAPFNRSDAHGAAEVADGCSWFRMSEATIEGLQQVACEPFTRISRSLPVPTSHSHLLGMRVQGGYCDGQIFRFNSGFNCIIGQNYSGKSAVLDLIRFGLATEDRLPIESREKLFGRLSGILGVGGTVDIYLFMNGMHCVKSRQLGALEGPLDDANCFGNAPATYSLSVDGGELIPLDGLVFPVEVYEQGRISRLRDDLMRQLQMLDEFSGTGELIRERDMLVEKIHVNARSLAPLVTELTGLELAIAQLPELKRDLAQKQKFLPSPEEAKWSTAASLVSEFSSVAKNVQDVTSRLMEVPPEGIAEPATDLETLFGLSAVSVNADEVVQAELLTNWAEEINSVRKNIADAKRNMLSALRNFALKQNEYQKQWNAAKSARDKQFAQRLAGAGVSSPQELMRIVEKLSSAISEVERRKAPRQTSVSAKVATLRNERAQLLDQLELKQKLITERRTLKAAELTKTLNEQIRVVVHAGKDLDAYRGALNSLCDSAGGFDKKVVKRDLQIENIVAKVPPRHLAYYLAQGGIVNFDDNTTGPLHTHCGVTPNTVDALVAVANDVLLLDKLETVICDDIPEVHVRRKGEKEYAELSAGLSQGEQSAAILTLALQTRSLPLIVDQPEDELGYGYVVHLVVPKMLEVKGERQMIIVTHNANIPVLGDADNVIQMVNRPRAEGGRSCQIGVHGCFESQEVTNALVELEGGKQAFQFRKHRYTLPHNEGIRVVVQGEVN